MTAVWMSVIIVCIYIPVKAYIMMVSDDAMRRGGMKPKRERKPVPPPDNKLPPLVGGAVTRRIARKF